MNKNESLTEQEARDKNIEEYNQTADAYDTWSQENILMQKYCYYSTFKEMENEGIEGKTFLEVGCGPCPIGTILAQKGAKKIYGLDISSEMIESAKKNLTEMGIIDKFELIVADIFDQSFKLPEKVDCVVLSYTLTTFINNYEMLASILSQCKKCVKDDGYMFIADFCWVNIPNENFWAGMYTTSKGEEAPKEFEPFNFIIDKAPDSPFEIFHIPNYLMFKAGYEAGFSSIEHKP